MGLESRARKSITSGRGNCVGKKRKKTKLTSWEELKAQRPVDEHAVAAYERLIGAEQILYQRWEQRGEGMNWVGEALGFPVEESDASWVAGLGEKVAALGGHLELVAVFPDETVTLIREPGPGSDPLHPKEPAESEEPDQDEEL